MIKGPSVVSLDCRAGMARRYVRRFNTYVAGMGWQVECTHVAKFDINVPLSWVVLEMFRTTGNGG